MHVVIGNHPRPHAFMDRSSSWYHPKPTFCCNFPYNSERNRAVRAKYITQCYESVYYRGINVIKCTFNKLSGIRGQSKAANGSNITDQV